VENIPLQAGRHSGKATKTVRLATGMALTFTTEYCSDSQRNGVRLQTGIAFIFDRIPHSVAVAVLSGIIAFCLGHFDGGSRSTFGASIPPICKMIR
jgi:hypothetical protein